MKTTNEKVQHTPTPWISEPINYDAYTAAIRIPDSLTGKSNGMGTIAHLVGTSAVGNAAFIVRAVNSHEGLINALKLAKATIERLKPSVPWEFTQGTRDVIDKAIAQAERK